MSGQPIRPVALSAARPQSVTPLNQSTVGETSSASSSVTAAAGSSGASNRNDQVIHRFYLKTVAVLGEGRLTHFGNAAGQAKGDKKKDKWFNLSLVEMDLHKADLAIFKSISNYSNPRPPFTEPANGGIIPPLLVAFILDTSDLPNNQALVWNREGSKVTLDSAALGLGNGKGKAREKDHRTGIVLERWTLQANALPAADVSSSQMAAHTAYRYGIAHFRALFALVRILPAYRLYRRLRRANTGLRLGIKLWGPEGYMTTPDDLDAAWEVMERDLIPLDVGLEQFITTESVDPATTERYDVPSVDLFGTSYQIGVEYRTEVDFTVEDMESVLSEKFVDMDEDWFTPTVARHRMEDESSRTTSSSGTSVGDRTTGRKVSNPTAIPTNSPIPQRQQAAAPGSFGSIGLGGSRPSGSRLASGGGSGARNVPGSQGSGRWGALAEGLPFGAPSPGAMDGRDASSPIASNALPRGATVAARRLSGHSINFSSSPSTSLLRSTPPLHQGTPPLAHRPGSSIGRTSSFLSQSGRSFTQAQLANMSPPIGSSPPVVSPISPSSLSFTKQPVVRTASGRAHYIPQKTSPPILSGSLERDNPSPHQPSPSGQGSSPQVIKRYGSSLSRGQGRLAGSNSSGEGSGTPTIPPSAVVYSSQASQSLLRRTSTRTSQESALRFSTTPGREEGDVDSFLSAMDGLSLAPSIPPQSVYAARPYLTSTSSSMSNPSPSAPASPMATSNTSPASQSANVQDRAPVTKAFLDDTLKRMMGSFDAESNRLSDSTALRPKLGSFRSSSPGGIGATNAPASVGLLTASRPQSVSRYNAPESPPRLTYRRQPSYHIGSPLGASPARVPLPDSPGPEPRAQPRKVSPSGQVARSLPGSGSAPLADEVGQPQRVTAPPTGSISPQTTGTSTATNESRASNRRGPVLLRGGFDPRPTKPSSSPSHSPIRDFVRSGSGPLSSRNVGLGPRGESMSLGYGFGRKATGAGQRTAPSSFGVADLDRTEEEEGSGGGARGRRSTRMSEGGMSPREEDEKDALGHVSRMTGDW